MLANGNRGDVEPEATASELVSVASGDGRPDDNGLRGNPPGAAASRPSASAVISPFADRVAAAAVRQGGCKRAVQQT